MIAYLLGMWLLFTAGIALERWRARRTLLFPVLWALHAAALVAAYGLAGYLGVL